MAEEVLTDKEQRSHYDRRWPSIQKEWQMYREAENTRKRHDEEMARQKQEEIEHREREVFLKRQEEQVRAAQERLRISQEEEKRKASIEADRRKAEEKEQRQRAEKERRLRSEQEASTRTEFVLERRRTELQEDAKRRIKQHFIDDQLQEQRDTWTRFRHKCEDISGSSVETHQFTNTGQACEHNIWVKRKEKVRCAACSSTRSLQCPDCLQVLCQTCANQRP
jgi:hypothetical protein